MRSSRSGRIPNQRPHNPQASAALTSSSNQRRAGSAVRSDPQQNTVNAVNPGDSEFATSAQVLMGIGAGQTTSRTTSPAEILLTLNENTSDQNARTNSDLIAQLFNRTKSELLTALQGEVLSGITVALPDLFDELFEYKEYHSLLDPTNNNKPFSEKIIADVITKSTFGQEAGLSLDNDWDWEVILSESASGIDYAEIKTMGDVVALAKENPDEFCETHAKRINWDNVIGDSTFESIITTREELHQLSTNVLAEVDSKLSKSKNIHTKFRDALLKQSLDLKKALAESVKTNDFNASIDKTTFDKFLETKVETWGPNNPTWGPDNPSEVNLGHLQTLCADLKVQADGDSVITRNIDLLFGDIIEKSNVNTFNLVKKFVFLLSRLKDPKLKKEYLTLFPDPASFNCPEGTTGRLFEVIEKMQADKLGTTILSRINTKANEMNAHVPDDNHPHTAPLTRAITLADEKGS